jgi:hypothetical protein
MYWFTNPGQFYKEQSFQLVVAKETIKIASCQNRRTESINKHLNF